MPYRVSKTSKTDEAGVFEAVLDRRNIIISGTALDPLDTGAVSKYTIPAGTPLAPVPATKKYLPIRRTLAAAAVNNDTTVTVDCAKPFQGCEGLGIRFYSALSATSTLRTISSVNTSTNVIVLTAAATIVDDDYIEACLNGAHGNSDSASATQIPDAVILEHAVEVLAADGATTYDTPAVGVFRGSIRRDRVNGPGIGSGGTTFDQLLKNQLPNIDFLPTSAGTA